MMPIVVALAFVASQNEQCMGLCVSNATEQNVSFMSCKT